MSFHENSMTASDQKPVRLRVRKDLIIQESIFQGEKSWVVKDPVALKYFRLQEAEYLVFKLLNGNTTYQQLKQKLDREFPDRIVRYDDLQALVGSFHRSGLLIADSTGQADPLLQRDRKEKRKKLLGLFTNVLSIRFPGVDPERFLSWGYPKIRWLFSFWMFLIVCTTAAAAGFLVLNNWETFIRKLPEFQRFFSAQNILFMGLVLMVTKVLHELGHGFFCKHFGGECHEIGFMLLVMTPAMYCNTSDSWVLPNKWHRAAIGAAGMYVEVFLASICTFVWWYSNPGFVHYFCLNVMFVSGVSTIIFNANPLLRYDGYYILSDILEVPNLSQKSRLAVISKMRVWFLGMKPVASRMLPNRNQELFAIYAIASIAYRWFVLFAILYFLSQIFEPWGLAVIGNILIAISLFGIIVVPIYKLIKFFIYPGRLRQVKRNRLIFTGCFLALIVFLVGFVPIPYHVMAPVVIRPNDAQTIYARTSGTVVKQHHGAGDPVLNGEAILILSDPALELEVEQLTSNLKELEERRDHLSNQLRRQVQINESEDLNRLTKEIQSTSKRLTEKRKRLNELTVKANRDGYLIPPSQTPRLPVTQASLGNWSRTPLDPVSKGAFLQEGTHVGYVGDLDSMKAVVVVEQSDIKFLQSGQKVEIMLHEYPGIRLKGSVTLIATEEKKFADPELITNDGALLKTRVDRSGMARPLVSCYEATVPLNDSRVPLLPGFKGEAKIRVGEATVAQMAVRYFFNLIHFR